MSDQEEGQYDENSQELIDDDDEDFSDQDMNADDLNFDDIPAFANLPPLDPWRKIRRELLQHINKSRHEEHGSLQDVYPDNIAQIAAQEYARYVLDDEEDDDKLTQFLKNCGASGQPVNCTVLLNLEDDLTDPKMLVEQFLDAHGLVLELHRDEILNPDVNHVGIGLGAFEMRICLVYVLNHKSVVCTEVDESDDGGIVVSGKILRNDLGIYVVTIVDRISMKQEVIVGPPQMDVNLDSGDFVVHLPYNDGFPCDDEGRAQKLIEFYMRNKPENIAYGQPSDEKFNTKHVEIANRIALERYPDPRHLLEQAKDEEARRALLDQEKHHREEIERKRLDEQRKRDEIREEQRKILQEMEKQRRMESQEFDQPQSAASSAQKSGFRSGLSSSSNISPEPGQSQEFSQGDLSGQSSQEESLLSDQEHDQDEERESEQHIKEELLIAIQESLDEQRKLQKDNSGLERKVVLLRQRTDSMAEKTTEGSTNLHKYLNTLANVHQVQFKMHEVQEQYDSWAQVYEDNILEKQERCREIQEYFRDFKREVARGAQYARVAKPIPQKLIDKWEREEAEVDKALHEVRIENITLKSRLAKLEQQSKDKEKLAEGLHVIDYEQLKIENQTMNEKIEERNEEIHKYQKKIEKDGQILTHTKEKLQFVQHQKEDLRKTRDELKKELASQRLTANVEKRKKKKNRNKYIQFKQETQILNLDSLNNDMKRRKMYVEELKQELKRCEETFARIQETIARAKNLV